MVRTSSTGRWNATSFPYSCGFMSKHLAVREEAKAFVEHTTIYFHTHIVTMLNFFHLAFKTKLEDKQKQTTLLGGLACQTLVWHA